MLSKEFSQYEPDYKIRKVKRERPDGSIEVRYEVLDKFGATQKVFSDRESAKSWAKFNI